MSVRKRVWKGRGGEPREAWVVDYVDQAGRRHIKTFSRKKEADAYHAMARVEVRAGTHTADSASITVNQAAALWLESCRGRGLERSTVDAYARHIRFHIAPFIGDAKLSRISAPAVRDFEDRLRRGDDGDRPRSAPMIRKVLTSLASLIEDARERGLIAVNAARQMRAGRKRGSEAQADRRKKGRLRIGVDVPTRAEIKAIVDHLEGRWRPIILTLVFTGLRSSELRALRWPDLDLKKSVLHVHQRVDQYMRFGPPKSAAANRSIPLPPIVANALRAWRLACPRGDLDLVFPTANGRPIGHSDLAIFGWQRAQISAGVANADGKAKYGGLHAARHFFASWLINSRNDGGLGLSAKAAQVRLGHSSITMTMDVYGSWFPSPDDHSELAAAEKELLG